MLYACNDLIRPDLILELSWRHGLNDFTMPYMINMLAQQTKELAILKADNEARKSKEQEQEKTDDNTPILGGSRLMITAGPGGNMGNASPAPYGQANGFAPQPTGYGY
jgi:clathrin heavy chain